MLIKGSPQYSSVVFFLAPIHLYAAADFARLAMNRISLSPKSALQNVGMRRRLHSNP